MKSLRCMVGLHAGHVEPAHLVPLWANDAGTVAVNDANAIEGRCAFVCSLCGAVIE